MVKKIFLFIIILFIIVTICFFMTSKILKNIDFRKDINILFVFKDCSNNDNKNVKIKFLISKYSNYDKYIKMIFVDENVTIIQKKKKSKTLKEMIVETEDKQQIDFAKKEIEKLFDNKLEFDFYISFDYENMEKLVEIFSKKKDFEYNKTLLNKCFNSDIDRDNRIIFSIKILNYMYSNSGIFSLLNLLKCLYDKSFILQTNLKTKEFLLLYLKMFKCDKVIKYADIPTVYRRNRTEIDINSMPKIINFFDKDEFTKEKNDLKIEILNSTNKSRLAIKAANKLRENNFDVVDWGSSLKKCDFTIIFDLVNSFENITEIKRILNCGEIIFRPADRPLTDVSVLLGQDCNIYDKLDRQSED